MNKIGEAFEDAEQLLIPGPAQDLHIARPALRAERPETRQLVAILPGRQHGEAAERDSSALISVEEPPSEIAARNQNSRNHSILFCN
jgi:hypothetical protein